MMSITAKKNRAYYDAVSDALDLAAEIESRCTFDLTRRIAETSGMDKALYFTNALFDEGLLVEVDAGKRFKIAERGAKTLAESRRYRETIQRQIRGTGECPFCHAIMMSLESIKTPGVHFWRCGTCGSFYNDADGQIGAAFGYDPAEVRSALADIDSKCFTADDYYEILEARNVLQETGRRRLAVLADEGFLEIDPAVEGGKLEITDAGRQIMA